MTDPTVIIKGALTASLALLVVALGLRASFTDATSLFRTAWQPPYRLVRALVTMQMFVPALAVGVALLVAGHRWVQCTRRARCGCRHSFYLLIATLLTPFYGVLVRRISAANPP